jgi:SAM-dependent methyltransferase
VIPPTSRRFRDVDPYRVEREWARYEGTGQRDLWRGLRDRFLGRHSVDARWVLDLGSGPGRFTARLGTANSRRAALDLSLGMLRSLREHWTIGPGAAEQPECVRGDGLAPPFPDGAFGEVAVLGNTLGFAGAAAERLEATAAALVAPGGVLVLEVAPGPGERSRYLARLPPSSLARLLRAPVAALGPRIEREGFATVPFRRAQEGEFRRIPPDELHRRFEERGWEIEETLAVAPVLGTMTLRIDPVRDDPKAWDHLIALEEQFGRRTERWNNAAAVLFAARRASGIRSLK